MKPCSKLHIGCTRFQRACNPWITHNQVQTQGYKKKGLAQAITGISEGSSEAEAIPGRLKRSSATHAQAKAQAAIGLSHPNMPTTHPEHAFPTCQSGKTAGLSEASRMLATWLILGDCRGKAVSRGSRFSKLVVRHAHVAFSSPVSGFTADRHCETHVLRMVVLAALSFFCAAPSGSYMLMTSFHSLFKFCNFFTLALAACKSNCS